MSASWSSRQCVCTDLRGSVSVLPALLLLPWCTWVFGQGVQRRVALWVRSKVMWCVSCTYSCSGSALCVGVSTDRCSTLFCCSGHRRRMWLKRVLAPPAGQTLFCLLFIVFLCFDWFDRFSFTRLGWSVPEFSLSLLSGLLQFSVSFHLVGLSVQSKVRTCWPLTHMFVMYRKWPAGVSSSRGTSTRWTF